MKILHIFNSLEYSGAEQMFLDSFLDLKKKGFTNEILITTSYKGKAHEKFLKKKILINQIKFSDIFIFKYLINILNLIKLFFILQNNRYDRVIINTERNFFSYSFISMYLLNIKTHRIIHSNFIYNNLLKIKRKIFVYFANKISVNFISVSDCVQKNELKNYNNKSKVLLNFIEIKKNKIKFKNHNIYKIFTVGNCSFVKQHELLINVLALLPLNIKWKYLHFGNEEKFKPEQVLAKKLNILKKCKFYGPTSNWYKYINQNSIFINCSSREGLGNATLEAISLGCIPIISNVPGNITIKKYIKDVVTYDNTIIDLKSKILNLIKLSKIQKFIITNKINSDLKKKFNKQIYIKEYQKLVCGK